MLNGPLCKILEDLGESIGRRAHNNLNYRFISVQSPDAKNCCVLDTLELAFQLNRATMFLQ